MRVSLRLRFLGVLGVQICCLGWIEHEGRKGDEEINQGRISVLEYSQNPAIRVHHSSTLKCAHSKNAVETADFTDSTDNLFVTIFLLAPRR
jgi:hypothetical protein